MADARRDENRVTVLLAESAADGETLIQLVANATTHVLSTSDGTTGSDLSDPDARRDGNTATAMMAVSSVDGVTPVPLYASASGELLIDST